VTIFIHKKGHVRDMTLIQIKLLIRAKL